MDRIFLDANVLFSAAYRAENGLLRFWELPDAVLLTSAYAIEEARRNLRDDMAVSRLDALIAKITIAPAPTGTTPLPEGVALPAKDMPILVAAIVASATHLVTGDLRHFGPLFGRTIGGVTIELPATYLARRN